MLRSSSGEYRTPRKGRGRALVFYVVVFVSAALALWLRNRDGLTGTVRFSGDEWSYQALAVNLLHGHGFQEGGAEPFSTYRFAGQRGDRDYLEMEYPPVVERPLPRYEAFVQRSRYLFFRTPGYPVFLACIYGIAGVDPDSVRMVQGLLLALTAVILVAGSRRLWGPTGLLSGLGAAALFVLRWVSNPREIMAGALTTFLLALWVAAEICWLERPTRARSAGLGALAALLVLVHAVTVFVPFVFGAFLLVSALRHRIRGDVVATFVTAVLLPLALWSAYASARSGRLVVVSTHGSWLIRDSNNEDALTDGRWHPEWRKQRATDPRYLYNRPEMKLRPVLVQVAHFLSQHRAEIPRFLLRKIKAALPASERPWLVCIVAGLILSAFWNRGNGYVGALGGGKALVPIFPVVFLLDIAVITMMFYGNFRFLLPFLPFFAMVAFQAPFAARRSRGRAESPSGTRARPLPGHLPLV